MRARISLLLALIVAATTFARTPAELRSDLSRSGQLRLHAPDPVARLQSEPQRLTSRADRRGGPSRHPGGFAGPWALPPSPPPRAILPVALLGWSPPPDIVITTCPQARRARAPPAVA